MGDRLASLISKILHPIFMPLIGVALLFTLPTFIGFMTHEKLKIVIVFYVTINTLILPLLFSLILKWKGIINSLQMDTVEERRWPYLFSILMFLVCIWLFKEVNVNPLLINFLLGAAVSIFILLITSYFHFKMSAHLLGIGGLVGVISVVAIKDYIDISTPLIILILLSGILGTARLQLKAHKPIEIYSGFLVGFLVQLFYL